MEATTLADRRKVARARRRPPSRSHVRVITADGNGEHGADTLPTPSELRLETTYADGRVVTWFEDNWWLEALRRWKDRPLQIHLLPTPDALLHPVVMHELEMVRRLGVPWRLVGHCYLSDVGHPLLLPRLAGSAYDEVRIFDATRPAGEAYDVRPPTMTLTELIERTREIQSEIDSSRPLFTRAPVPSS